MKFCPECRLGNADTVTKCKCGHDFEKRKMTPKSVLMAEAALQAPNDKSNNSNSKKQVGFKVPLIECKDCGNSVSTKAKICPQCGAKVRLPMTRGTWIAIGIAVFIVAIPMIGAITEETPVVHKSPEELRKEKIKESFSAWDGSHYGLTRAIKNSMNDPKSYEHAETIFIDKGDYLKVKTVFRGKNAFGGVVKNWVWAKVDLDGNVIKVIEQGS